MFDRVDTVSESTKITQYEFWDTDNQSAQTTQYESRDGNIQIKRTHTRGQNMLGEHEELFHVRWLKHQRPDEIRQENRECCTTTKVVLAFPVCQVTAHCCRSLVTT